MRTNAQAAVGRMLERRKAALKKAGKERAKSAPKTPDAGADTERRAIRQWAQRWAKKNVAFSPENEQSHFDVGRDVGAAYAILELNNFLDTRSRRYRAKAGGL
jgi:hypothetical protein